MELNRIFQLLDAGYTRAEIEAFEKGVEEAKPKEVKPEEIAANIEDNKETDTEEIKEQDNEEVIKLREQIEKLTNTIHMQNMRNDEFKNETLTADDALKNFILGG